LLSAFSIDVDARQPQHQGVHGFDRAGSRGGALAQRLPALGELGRARAVGEEAEVPDADEAVGHDVQEKAADELRRLQLHHLHAIAVGVVFPAEAHPAIVEAEEALVGQRDPMGVAAQVLEHLLGAGEGAFSVHDPVRLAKLAEPLREGRGVGEGGGGSGEDELTGVKGAPEGVEVFAPEDLAEGADGGEKAGGAGIQCEPSGARAPPVTTQCRCKCCDRFCPQVCRIAVAPRSPPR